MNNIELKAKLFDLGMNLQSNIKEFIRMDAYGTNGRKIFTTYGLVDSFDRDRIFFNKKYILSNDVLIEDPKGFNDEIYTKNNYIYDITFSNSFVKEDYSRLLSLSIYGKLPLYIFNILLNYINKNN